jgi:HD-GYP domain-containing protein (c-di-GMP phosphodiesterase class II)
MSRAPRLTDLIRESAAGRTRLPGTPPKRLTAEMELPPPDEPVVRESLDAPVAEVDEPPPPIAGHELEGEATKDYQLLEQWLARLYRNAAQGRFDPEGIFDDAAAIVARPSLIEGLFAETFRPRDESETLARAALNVAIYALRLGGRLRYGADDLRDLAVAALLHKIGLARLSLDVVIGRTIDSRGRQALQEHPKLARESIRGLGRRFEQVAEIVYQCHERIDGSGYPRGLREGQIAEPALVIGLAGVFEALSQPRQYRERMIPFAAVKEILQQERSRFPRSLLREFFASFSGFPPFTCVRLSSNAVARVVASDPAHPLRPTVVVLRDAAGRRPANAETLRLVEHPSLHIVGPVSEAEVG